jgi:hypothetical protein
MREFDDFEKKTIRKLKSFKEKGVNLNFLSLLDDFLNDKGVEITRSTKEGWIYFDVNKFAYYDSSINTWIPKVELTQEVASTTEIIIKTIFLLDYLEKNGLVFLYDLVQKDKDVESFPEIKISPHPLRLVISEKKVVELLIIFFHKEVVISQSIITLVNNDFLTKEEIQHSETIEYANRSLLTGEKSIKVANRAINISIALGLISVLLSLYSIVLNKQEIDQLEKSIENIDSKSKDKISVPLDSIAEKINKAN